MTCPFKERDTYRAYLVIPASDQVGKAYFSNLKDAREWQAKQPKHYNYEVYRKLKRITTRK